MVNTELIKEFKQKGFLILKEAFAKEFVNELKDYFFVKYKDSMPEKRQLIPLELTGPFNSKSFYHNAKVSPYLKTFLGVDYVIESAIAPTTNPNSETQHIHTDGGVLFNNKINFMLPAHAIGMLVPLIDMNCETGTLKIWPQTHITCPDLKGLKDDANSIEPALSQGDCILLDTRTYHCGTANKSDKTRPLVYLTFARPWYMNSIDFRAYPNLIMNDEEFNKVPSKLKHLFKRRNISIT